MSHDTRRTRRALVAAAVSLTVIGGWASVAPAAKKTVRTEKKSTRTLRNNKNNYSETIRIVETTITDEGSPASAGKSEPGTVTPAPASPAPPPLSAVCFSVPKAAWVSSLGSCSSTITAGG